MEAVSRIDGTIADVPYESYFRHSRPVIVTGVVDRWVACEKWTQHYLRSVLADTQVPVGVARSRHFRLDPSQSELEHPRQMLQFDAYANYVERGAGEDGLHYYLQRLPLPDYCPT
jgi:hypothetical protein